MKKAFYSLEEALRRPDDVYELCLQGKNLNEIPDRIGALIHLEKLTISHTGLKTLPAALGELKQLQYLNLCSNQLISLPPQIGQLTRLVTLDLRFNALQQLPDQISELADLNNLMLSHNQLQRLPDTVGELSQLQWLDLSFNELLSLPAQIAQLTELTHLNASKNQLQRLPLEIGELAKLRLLRLNDNLLETLPESFGQLGELRRLWMTYNRLESLPESFGQLSNLTSLALGHNYLMSLPASFGSLQSLHRLTLDGNPIHDVAVTIAQLGELPRLRVLGLRHCVLTEPVPEEKRLGIMMGHHSSSELPSLAACTGLTHLDLRNNLFATFPSAVLSLPNLQEVNLEDNPIKHVGAEVSQMLSPHLHIRWPWAVRSQYQEMDQMIRRFNREHTLNKLRMVSCLLYLKEPQQAQDWLTEHFTIPELLSLLSSNDTRLRKTVQAVLRDQLPYSLEKPANLAESVFYVGGKLEILTLAELTHWLETVGAQVAGTFDNRVTHFVPGTGAGEELRLAYEQNVHIVWENEFVGWMEIGEKPFLREDGPEAEQMRESVRELLLSDQPVNVMIGLQTMLSGGVPADLLGIVLGLFLCHPDVDTRVTAGQLFRKYASLSLQAHVRTYWRTNYSDYPAKAIKQGYLEDVLAHDEVDTGLVRVAVQLTGTGDHLLGKYASSQPAVIPAPTSVQPKRSFWRFWKK